MNSETPPVCDYEGSDYQTSFWDQGGRAYEDQVEAIALRRLLPDGGGRILDVGAGAGRNVPRYGGYQQVVLMDYSITQLQQAQSRLGKGDRYIYVAANVYRLPFSSGTFDAATMIRVIHHMADAPLALTQVRKVLKPGATFVLEFANKRNLKAIFRYLLGRQNWSPFKPEPVEFVKLNFDFHPDAIRTWLQECGFEIQRQLTVSHFRLGLLKRLLPLKLLVWMDSLAQLTGNWWQLTPSVFVQASAVSRIPVEDSNPLFCCPACGCMDLEFDTEAVHCPDCGRSYPIREGIYDFREV